MFKKIILSLFLIFTTQAVAKKEALLVGVEDYGGDPRNDLMGIDLDIRKMESLFKSWGFTPKVLYNQDSLSLKEYLKRYAKDLNSNDVFILYYSGHGSYVLDRNGDEADGKDEVLVLSDRISNIPLLDDNLNYYLNAIKARKLIIFDCCHSGTVNRGENSSIKVKSLPSNQLNSSFMPKEMGFDRGINGGEYVILSASRDSEKSLATSRGSLFTNELYKLLPTQAPLETIRKEATYNIVSYAKRIDKAPHHPQFTYSNPEFKNQSIIEYLNPTKNESQTLQSKLDSFIDNPKIAKIAISNNPPSYNTGEFVNFTLDTKGNRGYLTVLFVKKNKITVLYPNQKAPSRVIRGKYYFPQDFGNFKVRAFKNCNGCQRDKTSIYLLLTPEPIIDIQTLSTQKMLSFKKGSSRERAISKDVELVFEEPAKTSNSGLMVGRYDFFVY